MKYLWGVLFFLSAATMIGIGFYAQATHMDFFTEILLCLDMAVAMWWTWHLWIRARGGL